MATTGRAEGCEVRWFSAQEHLARRRGGAAVVVIGRRGAGKSSVLASLLEDCKDRYQSGIVMSETEEEDPFWVNFCPAAYIYPTHSEVAIQRLVDRQKRLVKERGAASAPYAFVVEDDTASDATLRNSPVVQQLMYNGRHWNIDFFMVCQDSLDLKRSLRGQIDYAVLLRDNNVESLRRLHANWCGVYADFGDFREMMDAVTTDHRVLVVNNTSLESDPSCVVAYYKGKRSSDLTAAPFKLGSKAFWGHASSASFREAEEAAPSRFRLEPRPPPPPSPSPPPSPVQRPRGLIPGAGAARDGAPPPPAPARHGGLGHLRRRGVVGPRRRAGQGAAR